MKEPNPTKLMLRTLARRSFHASKVRNVIAVIAIMLTAVLFTSVAAIAMGTMESMTLTMQMQKLSKSDGDFRNMTAAQFDALQQADFVKEAGLRMPVGFLENTIRHNIELDVMDETQAGLTFSLPSHGRFPQAANEIVTSDLALRDLGVEPETGVEIIIAFTAHGQSYSLPMVVSGWYEAVNDQTSMMAVSFAFRDAHPEVFEFTFQQDRAMAGTYWSDFLAVNTMGLQEKMEAFVLSVGGNPYDQNADNYLPGVINTMTNPKPDLKIIAAVGVFAALFIFCGYLLIYNVFDIAVMQEIRRYGLYRVVGMSKKQIQALMNRQAIWLFCIGTPLGLLAGFLIGRAALPIIMETVSGEYHNVAAQVSPSPAIFLCGTLLTAFTVALSTRKPVRVAANIPPIEAFRYVERGVGNKTSKKSSSASPFRMAWGGLGSNKRRTISIIVSLMLCVVLLNCVGTIAGSLDVAKQAAYMLRTDFAVTNTETMNNVKGFRLRELAVSDQTMTDIAAQPGVTEGNPVYKNTIEDTNVTYEFGFSFTEKYTDETTNLEIGVTQDNMAFSLGTDGRALCNVYGMEKASIARMDIREGETNVDTLYEKMQKGEGILLGVDVDRQTMEFIPELDFLNVGDMVTVYKDGQEAMKLPVLAKAALNGDDMEIGYVCYGPFVVGGIGLFLYLPTDIYEILYDEPAVYKYAFNVEENQREDMTAFLESYMQNTDPDINYLSAESAREGAEGTRTMIHFVGGLVGIIFGVVGILNLMNTLITTILTRRREFATMQSIGMTNRQLTKMMIFEGVFYAIGAGALGLVLAAILNLTLVKSIAGGIWYFTFRFTLFPAIITSAALILVSAVIPIAALKLFHKGSIVEKLRVTE